MQQAASRTRRRVLGLGPWSRRLGYGPLVRASSGMTARWRYPDDPTGFSDAATVYPDHVAARIGAAAVLALLVRRRRTGVGGTVSVSQAEVMLGHMAPMAAERALLRAGHDVEGPDGTDAPWGVYPTAGDDDWCVVTVRGDAHWQALCRVTDRPDLVADPGLADRAGQVAAHTRLDAALTDWLAARGATAAMELLQAAGVPAAAMLRVAELPSFPYFAQRRMFRTTSHPALPYEIVLENAPVRSLHLPDPPDRPAPLLGEHTEQVVAERLGLSSAETASFVNRNVLQPPKPAPAQPSTAPA